MTTPSPLPTIQLQVQLTRQHEAACRYQDTVPPGIAYSDKYWRNMDELWKTMTRYEAVENSLARAGQDSCINGPSGCGEAVVVSCRWCVPPAVAETLSGDSEAKEEYRW